MIVHVTNPEDINCGIMIAIVKNMGAKVKESYNFLAICLSVLCKIIDVLILKRMCSVLHKWSAIWFQR